MFSSVQSKLWVMGVPLALAGSCAGGTETDNPVIDFQSSGCKNQVSAFALGPPRVEPTTGRLDSDAPDYDGLHCYAWRHDPQSATLHVDVLNMHGGCQVDWSGEAKWRAEGGIDVQISNASCRTASCGWCLYDFSFELSGVEGSEPLPLALIEDDCESADIYSELVVPLDTEPSGMRCRPAFRHALGGGLAPACDGNRHMSCGELNCGSSAGDCNEGLLCSEIEKGDSRCMKTCEQDTDCGLDVLSCVEGTCALGATF